MRNFHKSTGSFGAGLLALCCSVLLSANATTGQFKTSDQSPQNLRAAPAGVLAAFTVKKGLMQDLVLPKTSVPTFFITVAPSTELYTLTLHVAVPLCKQMLHGG